MTLRDALTAAGAAVLILPLMAAAALGLLILSTAAADHAAIAAAIGAAPEADLGMPAIDQRRNGFREGFFPECAGLSLLLREPAAATPMVAVIRSDTILPAPARTICAELRSVLNGAGEGIAWFTYARYWHGSLLLHRAVLSAAGYGTLQTVSFALAGAALGLLFVALAWRVSLGAALAAAATLALLWDIAAVGLLPMQAVSVAALLACAAGFAALGAHRAGVGALVAAGVAGAAYNFFDFFCNPECLAALCAWTWAACGLVRGERRTLAGAAFVFAAVLAGYGGFWAAKWVIAAFHAAAGGEVYLFNAGDVDRWGPGNGGWFPGLALGSAAGQAFDAWWKGGIALALTAAAGLYAARGRAAAGRRAGPFLAGPPALQAALLALPIGLAWLVVEGLAGHTLAHTAITFRIVPLSLGLALASAILLVQIAPLSRRVATSAAV